MGETPSTDGIRVLIYSNANKAWWGKNGCGYYEDILKAGEFSIAEAFEHIGSGFNYRSGMKPKKSPADSIVPVTEKRWLERKAAQTPTP